jgi:OOP family OmpA-OmpF porin
MEFSDASIRIEGHTDSRGGDEANKALSQRRALAIREHLLTRLPISASRIEAVGIGEDRPIATNDTEDGRARNRRIEIILTLSG